jgi:oxygen-independent coproporphyrinogen-3 oxidase
MGVQSFDDRLLKWMNRRHTSLQAVQAYRILESAGVDNISIDLIFGLPQLTDELWQETMEKALSISSRGNLPKHISAYQLSVEEGSMLEKMISKGMCAEAPEEDCHRQYEMLCSVLHQAGYEHYEISNFAMPGYQAKHNSAYWKHVPYIGLGPGAHSFLDGKRMWNADDLSAYLKAGSNGDFSEIRGCETLDLEQKKIEKIMLGLRTAAGVEEEFLRDCCAGTVLAEALANGNLEVVGNGMVRIPEDRFFISDNIISSII